MCSCFWWSVCKIFVLMLNATREKMEMKPLNAFFFYCHPFLLFVHRFWISLKLVNPALVPTETVFPPKGSLVLITHRMVQCHLTSIKEWLFFSVKLNNEKGEICLGRFSLYINRSSFPLCTNSCLMSSIVVMRYIGKTIWNLAKLDISVI